MRHTAILISAGLSVTGRGSFMESAAKLAHESNGISWPGAFVVVGCAAAVAAMVVGFFRA